MVYLARESQVVSEATNTRGILIWELGTKSFSLLGIPSPPLLIRMIPNFMECINVMCETEPVVGSLKIGCLISTCLRLSHTRWIESDIALKWITAPLFFWEQYGARFKQMHNIND